MKLSSASTLRDSVIDSLGQALVLGGWVLVCITLGLASFDLDQRVMRMCERCVSAGPNPEDGAYVGV